MTKFSRLQMAVLADSFDGTISKEGRAELVHAFQAFKGEHSALELAAEHSQTALTKALVVVSNYVDGGQISDTYAKNTLAVIREALNTVSAVKFKSKSATSIGIEQAEFVG